jgi:hypothetical protein
VDTEELPPGAGPLNRFAPVSYHLAEGPILHI